MIELLESLNSVDFTSGELYIGVAIGVLFRNKAESAIRRAFSRKTTETITSRGKTDTQSEVQ